MDKPAAASPLISEAHRAKAARIAERLIDGLSDAIFVNGVRVDGPQIVGVADAIHKLDLVSRGPVSR